jgi:hypothetical protein
VIHGDAVEWLAHNTVPEHHSIFTSVPDLCEFTHKSITLEAWKAWFVRVVQQALEKCPADQFCIFYQSDTIVKDARTGQCAEWIDKAGLCMQAAVAVPACKLAWHKICTFDALHEPQACADTRANYSHMLCFSKGRSAHLPDSADVLHRGQLLWGRGTGIDACCAAVKFLLLQGGVAGVFDPFAGVGTTLAVYRLLFQILTVITCTIHGPRSAPIIFDFALHK